MNKAPILWVAGGLLAGSLATATIQTTEAAGEESDGQMKITDCHHRGANPEVKAAVEANDYTAFQQAIPDDSPLAGAIDSKEDFDQFVRMHELRQNGDQAGAKAIADELGLKPPKHGQHHRRG